LTLENVAFVLYNIYFNDLIAKILSEERATMYMCTVYIESMLQTYMYCAKAEVYTQVEYIILSL